MTVLEPLCVITTAINQPMYTVIPEEIRSKPVWLLWKYVQKSGEAKSRTVPFYLDGRARGSGVGLDTPDDIGRLSDFEKVAATFSSSGGTYSGIGFAVVGGYGIAGIDLDNCIDDTGRLTGEVVLEIYSRAKADGLYAEISPSGRGLRILGSTAGFQSFNRNGIEAYSAKRFLTVTGRCVLNPRRFGSIDGVVNLINRLVPGDKPSADGNDRYGIGAGIDLSVGGYSVPNTVSEGGRNTEVLRYVGYLRGSGVREELIPSLALLFNRAVCNPPLDSTEVTDIAGRYAKPIDGTNSADWPTPGKIAGALPAVPPFNFDVLPTSFRAYVQDSAELMQTPPEYIAIPLMIAAAAAIGNGIAVAPKAHDSSWLVPPILWGGIVGRPGTKKSPSMDKGLAHLKPLEADMAAMHQLKLQQYRTDRIAYETLAASVKAAVKKGQQPPVLPPEPLEPGPERIVVNDSTYQKLTDILQSSPRGVLIVRDELVGLLETLGSQGQEGARAFYLQGWNGNSQYRVDRIGRGSLVIERLALWVLGGIQPSMLDEYVRQAYHGGEGDDGLLQRFQLLGWPDFDEEWVNIDRQPDWLAFDAVEATFKSLRTITPVDISARTCPRTGIGYLHFSKTAQIKYDSTRSALEKLVRNDALHPALASHFAKYPSLLASLAIVIHLADGGTGPIGDVALDKAIHWVKYLIPHARRVYSAATNRSRYSAKALADRISNGGLSNVFSVRSVVRKGWSHLSQTNDVKEAVETLVDAGWLRQVDVRTAAGVKTTYTINPKIQRGCQ